MDGANAAMERYAEGDDSAFGELYEQVAPRVYAFLARRTTDRALVEDLVQQTFLQMHRARRHFSPGAAVLPWALVIAGRLLIDRFRLGKREPLLRGGDAEPEVTHAPARAPLPDRALAQRRLARRLEHELGDLPEASRVAFELLQFDGLTVAEAADVLGTTAGAVKMRAHRAYEALRARLGQGALEAW